MQLLVKVMQRVIYLRNNLINDEEGAVLLRAKPQPLAWTRKEHPSAQPADYYCTHDHSSPNTQVSLHRL